MGNNIALLEDPVEVARGLADPVLSVHLKDQAVCPCPEGFLLADVTLSHGIINLEQIIAVVRKANSHVRFSLELITRDPLSVGVLTEQYWETLPHATARQLARTYPQNSSCEQPQQSVLACRASFT